MEEKCSGSKEGCFIKLWGKLERCGRKEGGKQRKMQIKLIKFEK
jgi:hypothetical protein